VTANELRAWLAKAQLTQRHCAQLLGINERTMRRYCAGEPIPTLVAVAVKAICAMPATDEQIHEQFFSTRKVGWVGGYKEGWRAAETFHFGEVS